MLRSCYTEINPIFIVKLNNFIVLVFPKNEEAYLIIKAIQQGIHSISFIIIDLSLNHQKWLYIFKRRLMYHNISHLGLVYSEPVQW